MSASPDKGGTIAAGTVVPVFATLAVFLRCYVRKIKRCGLATDDWSIILGLVLTWVLAVIVLVGVSIHALGGHTAQNPKTGADLLTIDDVSSTKIAFTFNVVEKLTLGIIKISVVSFYKKIFVGRSFVIVSNAMLGLLVLWSLTFFFVTAFQCGTDISNSWNSPYTNLHYCLSAGKVQVAFASSDILTDFMILAIPFPCIWQLQLSRSRKVAVYGKFLLGLLSVAGGIVKLYYWIYLTFDTSTGYRDLMAVVTEVMVWGIVEASMAVIAACLPSLRPLFVGEKGAESLLPSWRLRFTSSYRRSQPSLDLGGFSSAAPPSHGAGNDAFEMNLEPRHPYALMNSISGHGSAMDNFSEHEILVRLLLPEALIQEIYQVEGSALIRSIVENYSKVPLEEVLHHVHAIRVSTWALRSYPCIGIGLYLNPLIPKSPAYREIVARARAGAQILDVGCFLGIGLHILAADASPTSCMHAMGMVDFWEQGFHMFREEDRFRQVRYVQADLVDANPPPEFRALQGKMYVVLVTHVLHQWSWDRQVEDCVRLASFTRDVGALIVGFQVGGVEPGEKVDRRYTVQESLAHDIASFKRLWKEVSEKTGLKWAVEAKLVDWEQWGMEA